jgi:hypothetical protein
MKKKLNSFTLFPKLPIELRLKIWRCSFPRGRSISPDSYLTYGDYGPPNFYATAVKIKTVESWRDVPPTEFPVALWVNKESRQETSRHYIIILPKGQPNFRLRAVCYSPSLDNAFTDLYSPDRILPVMHSVKSYLKFLRSLPQQKC